MKYLGSNEIDDIGCLHLSKAHWPYLQTIDLSKNIKYLEYNKIGAEGCLYLSKAYWPNLQNIWFSREDLEYLGCH